MAVVKNSLLQGQVFGGYLLKKRLGGGGFGEVYEAEKNQRLFAVKAISYPGNEKILLEEALAESVKLVCPFLVNYYGTFRESGGFFIVMELCQKGDLRELIDHPDRTWYSPKRVMKIFLQVLIGLYVLHHNHIIHRDLKPENVFLSDSDDAKIGDFGCGKIMDSSSVKATTKAGTLAYMSPEVVKEQPHDGKADVWSLGVVMYEILTGRRPFVAAEGLLGGEITTKPFAPIKKIFDDRVSEIVHSMLEKASELISLILEIMYRTATVIDFSSPQRIELLKKINAFPKLLLFRSEVVDYDRRLQTDFVILHLYPGDKEICSELEPVVQCLVGFVESLTRPKEVTETMDWDQGTKFKIQKAKNVLRHLSDITLFFDSGIFTHVLKYLESVPDLLEQDAADFLCVLFCGGHFRGRKLDDTYLPVVMKRLGDGSPKLLVTTLLEGLNSLLRFDVENDVLFDAVASSGLVLLLLNKLPSNYERVNIYDILLVSEILEHICHNGLGNEETTGVKSGDADYNRHRSLFDNVKGIDSFLAQVSIIDKYDNGSPFISVIEKEQLAKIRRHISICVCCLKKGQFADPPDKYGLVLAEVRLHIGEKNEDRLWNGKEAWDGMVNPERVLGEEKKKGCCVIL